MVMVDAQVHSLGPETPQRPWAPGDANEARHLLPMGKDAHLWQLEVVRLHPHRFEVMGRLPMEKS